MDAWRLEGKPPYRDMGDIMKIYKTAYFDEFRCIASACSDSCCKEWGVQVDGVSAAYYRSLAGPLGDRLREVLCDEDGETVMTIVDGRCPMWRADGLCRIQAELGEGALCKTCREFPRLTHDYGDFIEMGLELSCPEAARMILNAPIDRGIAVLARNDGENAEPEYDVEAMAVLRRTRERALAILGEKNRSMGEILALLLLYGYQAQGELDGEEETAFAADSALDSVREMAKKADIREIPEFFLGLEILTREWKERLECPNPENWDGRTAAMAGYFVGRYWLQAVSDYDLVGRVKFMIIACLLVKTLGGDFEKTAQLFSKEIENDADNVEAILDGAYGHPAFTDDKLLGWLLG